MPDQMPTASTESTPSSGSISGMIGLRKLTDMVMMNWMPTMAHSVRCQRPAEVWEIGRSIMRRPCYRTGRACKGFPRSRQDCIGPASAP